MGSKEKSETKMTETPLSKKQLEVLNNRETFAQEHYFPELENFMGEMSQASLNTDFGADSFSTGLIADQQVSTINDSFTVAQENTSQELAKRGLAGSGIEASTLGQLLGAKASAVGSTVNQARLDSIKGVQNARAMSNSAIANQASLRSSGLKMALASVPQSTTAAPMGQTTTKKGGANPYATAAIGATGSILGGLVD